MSDDIFDDIAKEAEPLTAAGSTGLPGRPEPGDDQELRNNLPGHGALGPLEQLRKDGWWAINLSEGIPGAPCKWRMTRGSTEHAKTVWGEAKNFDDALEQMQQVDPLNASAQLNTRAWSTVSPKWTPPKPERPKVTP